MAEVEHPDAGSPDIETAGHAGHGGHPSSKEYVRIFLILAVFTGLEVAVKYRLTGTVFLFTLFALAITKFILVAMYFMHLKFDDRRYARFFLMGLAGAATLFTIVLLTFKVFSR